MGTLEALAERAVSGEQAALSELCVSLEAPIFRLCLRILGDPADAEDATQEVLVKVITNLATFEGRSALGTWVHRIAARHVLAMRRSRAEERAIDPDAFAALLDQGMAFGASQPAPTPEDRTLIAEIRLSCTQGMLLALGREERLALVLCDLLGFDGAEAAEIADTSQDAFRQRLSRARKKLGEFLLARCGVVSEEASCRCAGQVAAKKSLGLTKLRLTPLAQGDLPSPSEVAVAAIELRTLRSIGAAFREGGLVAAPATLRERMRLALPSLL